MTEELISIELQHIHPHPDNPRKDLGDVSELVDSVKQYGIMQNLTIVPKENEPGEYLALIGHRRHRAATLAGLKEVPCKIVKGLSRKDQIGIMLIENIQRNDLTILEQAQGFQMMLELGDTAEIIAEKTGFSKTTVYHRLNIAKLDKKELQKKTDSDGVYQLTLKDLYALEQIENIKTRNKILKESSSSRDLVWRAKQAVTSEIRARNLKKFKELFKKSGIKQAPESAINERYSGKWSILLEWELDKEVPKTLKKFKEENIQWVVYYERTVAIIVPIKAKEKKLSEREIKERDRKKAKKELKQHHKEIYRKIDICIMEIIREEIEPLKEDVELYSELLMTIIRANVDFYRSDLARFYSGKGLYELEHDEQKKYQEFTKWEENLNSLHMAMAYLSSIKNVEMYDYNAGYDKANANRVKAVVDFLSKYGFSVSDEEQKIIDGTHELYVKENR